LKPELTAERLRELLHYDQETGIFTWTQRPSEMARKCAPGAVAGSVCKVHGYVYIGIDWVKHPAHRLAWLYVRGEWPQFDIDHIDGDRANNRIGNLRDVSRSVNLQNARKARSDSQSGLLGALRNRNRWMSRIKANGRMIHLGSFDTPEEAHAAYLAAKRKLHEGCTI
jgi:hypothetical protein